MTIAEFLLARIAEDSSVAFFAQQDEQLVGSLAEHALFEDDHRRIHAARWSPERVLAECDARRQLVELHSRNKQIRWGDYCDGCSEECLHCEGDHPWPCATLRLLALPHADHPDYLEEWKP